MNLKGQAVIVTGGASGMGAATADLLHRQGATVALFDLNEEAVMKKAATLNGLGVVCDVTDEGSVQEALNKSEAVQGIARIVINCAGIVLAKKIVGKEGPMPLRAFRRVIDINLVGTFNVMRLAAARMMTLPSLDSTEERGVIINTASVAAFEGQIGQTAYSASKGAIVAMTLPAARELADVGIRVMTIAPGLVDTPMFDQLSNDVRATLGAMVPFPKRLATPEEYAHLAQHIIENAMLNGEVIRLDGALRMQAK